MLLNWLYTLPNEIGYYIVETKSMMGKLERFQRLEAYWNGKKWSFTNQEFVRRLDMPNIHNY